MCDYGEFSLEQIKEDVREICESMGLPLRQVLVNADYTSNTFHVEVETFKDFETLEDILAEELKIEEKLRETYGDRISVDIVCVEEEY